MTARGSPEAVVMHTGTYPYRPRRRFSQASSVHGNLRLFQMIEAFFGAAS